MLGRLMSKVIINYPDTVDLTEYSKASTEIIKYGLPKDVKFCNSCVMTNQLPKSEVEHTHNILTKNLYLKQCII